MSETKEITIRELLQDIDAATARMGKNNPHRLLLVRCAYGLIEMTQRAHKVEHVAEADNMMGKDVEGVPV